jgi:uncharacterized protein with von Willebrand factor type A (vWA) domain
MSGPARERGSAGDRLLAMLLQLFEALRGAGVDVSMVEVIDAASALPHLDLADRGLLRQCLQATLIKRPEDREVFARLFERCFPLRLGSDVATDRAPTAPADGGAIGGDLPAPDEAARATSGTLSELLEAIQRGDDDALRLLVVDAVDVHADIGDQRGSERSFVYRVLRALDLSNLMIAAMAQVRAEGDLGPFELRQRRDELAARIERLRRMIAEEVHRRLLADSSRPGVGLIAPRRLEDLDVLQASTTELRALRSAVRPLARKLASRIAERRRRHHRGRLDVRRTVRRSIGHGGVPLDPAFRVRRPSKPDVVVLCDVSGSVAEFAHFTLMLLSALQAELSGLRTFVFVDGIADVTPLLDADRALDPRLLVTLPGVVSGDGHSDYGAAFARFLERHGSVVGPGTTLLVTGDARTNHRSPGLRAFRELCRRARRVYWLDPEPAAEWDTHDSALGLYRETCTGVFEVRSLAQLTDAVAAIM